MTTPTAEKRIPYALVNKLRRLAEELPEPEVSPGSPATASKLVGVEGRVELLSEYYTRDAHSQKTYELAMGLAAYGLNIAHRTGYEPPVEEVKVLEVPQGCQHVVVPVKAGWGRCIECKEDGFPLTAEAAGECPCCGGHGSCPEGCDGKTPRMPWALALRALANLAQHRASDVASRGAQLTHLDLVENDLHRITGNLRVYSIPIKGTEPQRSVLVEYLGARPLRAFSSVANTPEELQRALESAGLRLKNGPVTTINMLAGEMVLNVELVSTRVETTPGVNTPSCPHPQSRYLSHTGDGEDRCETRECLICRQTFTRSAWS